MYIVWSLNGVLILTIVLFNYINFSINFIQRDISWKYVKHVFLTEFCGIRPDRPSLTDEHGLELRFDRTCSCFKQHTSFSALLLLRPRKLAHILNNTQISLHYLNNSSAEKLVCCLEHEQVSEVSITAVQRNLCVV